MSPRRLWTSLALVALTAIPGAALADWPHDPAVNVPVATGAREQVSPRAIPDGAGGALIAYEDYSGTQVRAIYVQHMLASGVADPAWPPGGRYVPSVQVLAGSARITGDGAGGAIVAWTDDHLGTQHYASTAHVLANGTIDVTWLVNASAPIGYTSYDGAPAIVSDGAGGAVVSWCFDTGGYIPPNYRYELRSQHVLASGAVDPAWPAGGRKVMGVGDYPFSLTSAPDGAGGAFIAVRDLWGYVQTDPEHTPYPYYGVIMHHVLANGAADVRWAAGGQRLSSSSYSYYLPALESDLHGGVWLTLAGPGVRPIRMNADVSSVGGLTIPGGWSGSPTVPIVVDAAGNAILTCASSASPILRAYRMRSGGTWDPAWPAAGRPLSTQAHGMYSQCATSDGSGGAIVVWQETRSGGTLDLFAQHVLDNGAIDPTWPADGAPVSTAANSQLGPCTISDGQHGAIAVWQDHRNGSNADIYAQRVDQALATLEVASGAEALAFSRPLPNPAAGRTTLRFALPTAARVKLAVYDASGRRVRTLLDVLCESGEHAVMWDLRTDDGAALAPGLYFARLSATSRELTQRIVVLD